MRNHSGYTKRARQQKETGKRDWDSGVHLVRLDSGCSHWHYEGTEACWSIEQLRPECDLNLPWVILVCKVCSVTILEPVLCYFLSPLTMNTNSRNILFHFCYIRILLHHRFSHRTGQWAKYAHYYFLCWRNTCQIAEASVLHLPFSWSGLEPLAASHNQQSRVGHLCCPHQAHGQTERCAQDCSVWLSKWITS